jgi:cholesterol oxidase
LGLAEKAGAKVFAEHTVTKIEELANGSWKIYARKSSSWFGRKRIFTANQVVVAAGTYNTQKLLHKMKDSGTLPKLSNYLGKLSRTNSEALTGAMMKDTEIDYSKGSAITSSFFPDEHTHVEPVRYGVGSNAMGLLQTIMTDGNTGKERRSQWLREVVRNPNLLRKILDVRKWSQRTVIALVMQNVDSSVKVSGKRSLFGYRLTSIQDSEKPNATYIPAHFVGGCVIGDSPKTGVIDPYHRVWNYPTLHIVDGSSVTANLGVNPSLTITAQAERALSFWPNKNEADPRPIQGSAYKKIGWIRPKAAFVPAGAFGQLRVI